MKLSLSLAAIITLLGLVAAHEPSKQVIVSYPQDTPDSVITQAMNALIAAGGIITHEYSEFGCFVTEEYVKANLFSSDQVCCPLRNPPNQWLAAERINQRFCSNSLC